MTISEQKPSKESTAVPRPFHRNPHDRWWRLVETSLRAAEGELGQFNETYDNAASATVWNWPGKRDSLRLNPAAQTDCTLKAVPRRVVDLTLPKTCLIEGDNLEVASSCLQKSYYGPGENDLISTRLTTPAKDLSNRINFCRKLDNFCSMRV